MLGHDRGSVGEGGGAAGSSAENHRLKQAISQAVAIVAEQGTGSGSQKGPGQGPQGQGPGTHSPSPVTSTPGTGTTTPINTTGTSTSKHTGGVSDRRSLDRRSAGNAPGHGLGPGHASGHGLGPGHGQGKRNSVVLKGTHPHYGHGHPKEKDQRVVLGQGKIFAEEILHKSDLITMGYRCHTRYHHTNYSIYHTHCILSFLFTVLT